MEVVSSALPLPFALECQRWMMPSRDELEHERLFSGDQIRSLEEVLVARAVESDLQNPLYRQFKSDARQIYWLWNKSDHTELSNRLHTNLTYSDDEVDAYLAIYIGETWSSDGTPRRSDYRRESYDDLCTMIDPDLIASLLSARYGSSLGKPEFHPPENLPEALQVAHQFMAVHMAVCEERSEPLEKSPGSDGTTDDV